MTNSRRTFSIVILALFFWQLQSCTCAKSPLDEGDKGATSEMTPPAPDSDKVAPDYSGITIPQVITKELRPGQGTGKVQMGSKVTGHYQMWVYAPANLQNRGKFISEALREKKEAVTFEVGKSEVIKGWEEGVVGMKVGGKRSIIIPADLAYGTSGTETVPPGAILLLEFEVTKIR